MADAKLTALSAIAAVAAEDLFYVVDDPAGTPASTKATGTQVATMVKSAAALLADIVEDTTPQLGGNLDLNTFDLLLDSDTMFSFEAAAGTLTLYSTEAGAGSFGLDFHRDSATPADDDILASINFYGEDDGSAKTLYAAIRAEAGDVTNATEDGRLDFDLLSAGSTVTALTLDATAGHTLSVGATTNTLTLYSSEDGAASFGLDFHRDSATPADDDVLSSINFYGEDDGSNKTLYAAIRAEAADVTSATEDGRLEFDVLTGGSTLTALSLGDAPYLLTLPDVDYSKFRVQNSWAGVGGPVLQLYQNSASPAAGDNVGYIDYMGENSVSGQIIYGSIRTDIADPTSTSEDGRIVCEVYSAGSRVERLRIDGDGLKFNGDTAAANALSDYEEGTFTPGYSTTGTNFTSVTYDALRGGYYVKVGDLVHCQGYIRTDAITVGSASGVVTLTGLPFTHINSSAGGRAATVVTFRGSFAGDMPMGGIVQDSTTYTELTYITTANGATAFLAPSDMGTGANANEMFFSCTYRVA